MNTFRILALAPLLLVLVTGCGSKEDTPKTAEGPAPSPAPAAAAPAVPPGAMDTAPSAVSGRLKYAAVCLGCHGPDGKGQGPFPKLAGKPAAELAAMLVDYRAGKTRGPQSATMMPFAKPLSDAEIQAIADYLSAS